MEVNPFSSTGEQQMTITPAVQVTSGSKWEGAMGYLRGGYLLTADFGKAIRPLNIGLEFRSPRLSRRFTPKDTVAAEGSIPVVINYPASMKPDGM